MCSKFKLEPSITLASSTHLRFQMHLLQFQMHFQGCLTYGATSSVLAEQFLPLVAISEKIRFRMTSLQSEVLCSQPHPQNHLQLL